MIPWWRCPCISVSQFKCWCQSPEGQHCHLHVQGDTCVPWEWFLSLLSDCVYRALWFMAGGTTSSLCNFKYLVLRFYIFGRFNTFLEALYLHHIALVSYAGCIINKKLKCFHHRYLKVAKESSSLLLLHSLPSPKDDTTEMDYYWKCPEPWWKYECCSTSHKITLCVCNRLGEKMDVALCSP